LLVLVFIVYQISNEPTKLNYSTVPKSTLESILAKFSNQQMLAA